MSSKVSSSEEEDSTNVGMSVGIVVGAVALVAIVGVAAYCVLSTSGKRGKIDPSIYEEDVEFHSMSVL